MTDDAKRIRDLETALEAMLPENCGMADDPSGGHRPSFEKCERARALLARRVANE